MSADTADTHLQAVALARATAAVLSLGIWIALLVAGVTACAAWRLASGAAPRTGWLADVALGAAALHFAVRVRLDERLFGDVANAMSQGASEAAALDALDAALGTLRLRKPPGAARTLAERARATLRLLRWQAVLALAQLALAVVLLMAP